VLSIANIPIFATVNVKSFKINKTALGIIFLSGCLVFGGCASSNNGLQSSKHKKLQPGKPIPCPAKDCD